MKALHLIAFNVPYPPNYGGVIDVFFKIKALANLGISIHLHTFKYGRTPQKELKKWCKSVTYYTRNTHFLQQFSSLPYIVKSRQHKQLLINLKKDNAPILFEGLHTVGFLNHPDLKHRQKIVRMHNIEWEYYEHLAMMESNFLKKSYFKLESWRLKRFEPIIQAADILLAIALTDKTYLEKKYPTVKNIFVPAFHANETVNSQKGRGAYALFHGDLSVKDNEKAALFLIEKVFNDLAIPLIIAGLNPTKSLTQKCETASNIVLKANVSNEEMKELIQNAQLHVLLSFHVAGMKLKLLNALFNGRFCIVNPPIVAGTGLQDLCVVAVTAPAIKAAITTYFEKEFTPILIKQRQEKLDITISNEQGALKIIGSTIKI